MENKEFSHSVCEKFANLPAAKAFCGIWGEILFNHDEVRTRKLLMHKREILKLHDKIRLEGYTLVPLKVYFKNNRAKVLLGLCKGKKNYDKRETIKERDIKRQIEKQSKNRY